MRHIVTSLLCTVLVINSFSQSTTLQPPPQDKGLPYTRSSQSHAMAAVKTALPFSAAAAMLMLTVIKYV